MAKGLDKTVFVGVSGGVDSSVTAALLIEQGYTVVGVFIRTWQPDFIECTWRDERLDAMRVCAHLGIPFLECDAEEAYKNGVADYMIEEYKKGNTPNPDVMCNREVKFGVFWKYAKEHGADYIATGHYAVNTPPPSAPPLSKGGKFSPCQGGVAESRRGAFALRKSPDQSKDQSYFLWTLTQDDFFHTLFPVGHREKKDVRKLAEKYKLPTAAKKDSQGVCFLGPLDMKEFLSHYIDRKDGDVLDEKGNVIGHHDGAVFFTLGERHGFTITKHTTDDVPLYVISKDIEKNTIIVSDKISQVQKFLSSGPRVETPARSESNFCTIEIRNTNWISGIPEKDKKYTAQIRYHGEQLSCSIKSENNQMLVIFDEPVLVSPGQSIVVYDGDVCLGGGVVI